MVKENSVICALIKKEDFILIAKKQNGKWEFPSGIPEDKDELHAVEREMYEEYNLKVKAIKYIESTEYRNTTFKLYECEYIKGNFRSYNFVDYKWIKPKFLKDYDLIKIDQDFIKYI